MFMIIPTAAIAQSTVTLAVNTQYADGTPLTGIWTVLRSGGPAGSIVATGFSPVTFNLSPSQQYTVSVGNYQDITFHHWQDTGSTTAARQITITTATTVTALYTSTAHPLPPEDPDPPEDEPPSSDPVVVMENTNITNSYGIYSTKPARAEHATPSSVLIGKQIDEITVAVRRVGTITGNAQIGVFDASGGLKRLFGTLDVASVPATIHPNMNEYTFSIDDLYTIAAGDRIGIWYAGGSSSAYLAVALDYDLPAFDGQNSYHQYFQNGVWNNAPNSQDMWLILKQTKGGSNQPPVVQPVSTTVQENSKTGVAIALVGSDPEGQPLTFYPTTQPAKGTLSLANGNIMTYTPYDWHDGPDSFQYAAHDGVQASAPATVSINIQNVGAKTTSKIVVITLFEDGKSHTGAFTTLAQGGTVINSGFSHIDFTVNNNQNYVVTVSSFGSNVFLRWDNGSTNPSRTINISQDTAIIAYYSGGSFTPVTHMEDTTTSYGVLTSGGAGQQIAAEWAKSTSVLVGKPIDSITLMLAKQGSPTGTAEIAVFDINKNIKKSFGTINVATLPTATAGAVEAYMQVEFTIPDLYTIAADDRIGIRYTGGSSSAGVLVMMDKVTTDNIFDGQNTQRVRGVPSGWNTSDLNEDLWMILKQTKP